jgi:hypothetical protein
VTSVDAEGNKSGSDVHSLTTEAEIISAISAPPAEPQPVISDVMVSNTTSEAAVITWKTNEASTSQAEYGTTATYGSSSTPDEALVQEHSVALTGLTSDTAYHYRVRSKTASGKEAVSDDAIFSTSPAPTPTPAPQPSPLTVRLQSVDLEAEVVAIVNTGTSSIDMSGWRLVSTVGNQSYVFPSFQLAAGATVRIVSGRNAVDRPPTQLLWTRSYVWNNDGDPAQLYDASNTLVSSYP